MEAESKLIRAWFEHAVRSVDPEHAVRRSLSWDGQSLWVGDHELSVAGRIWIAAIGKAAVGMARAAAEICHDRLAGGIVITKDGHAEGAAIADVRIFEASHPIPDERGVAATREMLAMVRGAAPDDLVLALISGGGSALLEAPRPPVTLADMARTTDLLLRAGAPIGDLNTVRIPLSLVKGGGLRNAAGQAGFATLILSDVLGNDPRLIASGPTVDTVATGQDALDVLGRFDLVDRVPASVNGMLAARRSGVNEARPRSEPIVVVGDNAMAVDEICRAATDSGFDVSVSWVAREGEAATLGREWVAECIRSSDDVDVVLGGGEATVTVRGDGIGGRNTEFALAAALALAERGVDDWVVASVATDGQDGPTGVAGAVADAGTVARAAEAGVDASRALTENDSLRVFEAAGGVIRPGPTGTNVNDIYIGVRRSALRLKSLNRG